MCEPRRDHGMTLIELLVVIAVFGLLVTVISAAITVVLRQSPETEARLDTARWEQNLGTWLPADLTSAQWPEDSDGDGVPDDPSQAVDFVAYEPCALAICTFGDNVAHLAWTEGAVRVDVSYRYGPTDDGSYEFRRIECRDGGACNSITLVRDMPEPIGGIPPIAVTFPPDVEDTDPNGSPIVDSSGRRVTVSVQGIQGLDLLTFTGGGVELVDLQPAAIQPPQFLQARSGCGGPITLIVDESGSLTNSDAAQVRTGVRSFVETFAGTPTQLQIVGFSADARVLGASGSTWNNWYDLSEQSTVDFLLGGSSPINGLDNDGATNWEDALYRAFYTEGGISYQALANPARPPAELVVFFTDGMPTYDRTDDRTGPTTPAIDTASIPDHFDWGATTASAYTQFSPVAWYRARWILQQSATRVIGVGVGTAFGMSANLDRDTDIPDADIAGDWSAPYGPSDGYSHPRALPAEVTFGDLIAGNDVSNYAGSTTGRYVKVEYDGGWDAEAVKSADLLTTTDFSQFGGALESIALSECGGTLTVQTRRLSDGAPLPATVTYEVSGEGRPVTESSTSAVSKTAVFDISTEDGTSSDVALRPRTLAGTGFDAHSWTCRSKNVAITDPAKLSLTDAGAGPIAGIDITVEANQAVSCILFVVPE